MRAILFSALLAAVPLAHADTINCGVHSDYSVELRDSRYQFESKSTGEKPANVAIADGKLWIDGAVAKLEAADQQRLRDIQAELTALTPKIKVLAIDAADVAFTAINEVGRGFGINEQSISKLDDLRKQIKSELSAMPASSINTKKLEAMVEPAMEKVMAELMPSVIGSAISQGIAAAFSGGDSSISQFETKMDQMGKLIEQKVESQVKSLEPRIKNMCEQLKRIDRIEQSLQYRLPNGKPLNLIEVEPDADKTTASI